MLSTIARRARPLAWRVQSIAYRGDQFRCSVCDFEAATMLPLVGSCLIRGEPVDLTTTNAICPRCRSGIRQRLLARYLRDRTSILDGGRKVLHIAPEHGIAAMLHEHCDYLGLDLDPSRFPGAIKGDVTDLPFSNRFDAVVCCHVLEHIPDDALAVANIYRSLRTGGVALIEVPTYGPVTYERQGLDAVGRVREYGCADHFRLNGRDFADRLTAAGFDVEVVTPDDLPGDWLDRSVSTPHTESDRLLFVATKHQRLASGVKTAG